MASSVTEGIRTALGYLFGFGEKTRTTSIGQALPHAVPNTRVEALENLRYIEGELERAFNSITVYEDSEPIQHLTVFQRVLTSWTIPLVQMAVLVLDDHNFAVIERSAYNILLIINPYCERELQYGIPPAGKEMRESKLRAREATLEFGRIIERINPDIKVDDSNDSETARDLVRSLTAYHLS